MVSNPLTHYVVIRRDLTFGEYSAQLAHAGEAYALLFAKKPSHGCDDDCALCTFRFNTTIAVVKGARNVLKLFKLEQALIDAKVPHVAICEEQGKKGGRLAGQLTCISLMPAEREKVEPFVREFHTIEGLDGP